MRLFCQRACLLLTLLVASAPAFAQTTGSINGTVTDNTSAVLPGVAVTATSPALMGTQTAVTNAEGQYRFPTLPPGTYRLSYELAGFTTVVRDGIVVQVGFTATVGVQLSLASLQETVTVSGASPVVDVQNTNIQNNFNNEMLKSIPTARDIWALIGVTPGVNVERFDVGGSRAGTQTGYQTYGLSGQVRVMADGANLTEETGGAPYFDFGAFDEVQIGTDSNDASMPSPGLLINTVIKSGGNDARGEIYFDYEDETLQSRNVTNEQRRVGVGEGSRITSYYDPNFNVGGPLKRDKFWYFLSFRGQRIGTTVTGFPADVPSDFEFVTRLTGITYKLTYQLNQNNKVSQWLQFRRKEQPHRDADSDRYLDAVFKQDSISPYGGAEWHRIVTPTFFFNARFGTWGYNWGNYAYGGDLSVNDNFVRRMIERETEIQKGSAFADRTFRRRYQFDWTGVLYRDAWAGGNHAIKVGYLSEWETQRNMDDGYHEELRLRFDSPASAPFTVPWRVQIYNTPTTAKEALWHHGAYVHDQVNIGRKITINAGLRWDYYNSYHPEQEIQAGPFRDFFYAGRPLPNGYAIPATFPDFHVPEIESILRYKAAFGPRLGIAYDLFGDGKNVIKASWGRYLHNPGPISDYNPIRNINFTFAWNDRNRDRLFTFDELGDFVSSSGSSRDFVDPNIDHPYTDDVSLFFEREIAANLGGRIGFIYKNQNKLFETIEQARVASLYTQARQITDNGPDGLRGTADDGSFTIYDIPSNVALPPSVGRLETPEENYNRYKNVEFTLNKRMSDRWSLVASAHHTWADTSLWGKPEDPNEALYNEYSFTDWSFKMFGTYRAPLGIVVSPLIRHQSGDPLRRIVRVTLRSGTFNHTAEGFGKYRIDNPTLVDTRVEKRFRLPRNQMFGLFFDAFNILNSNAVEAADNVTGRRTTEVNGQPIEYPQFFRPTRILNPRVFRFGFKYEF